jgi:NAD(P)H-nitrite reductase large subunit
MVVIAIGVTPRIDLVANTDIKVSRGITVNRYMTTSHPDVFACGDVVNAYDFISEQNQVIPIWPNAYIGGRVAGYNMAGVETEYQGGTTLNALSYFGMSIVSAGIVAPIGEDYEVISQKRDNFYKKIVLHNDVIAGMIFIEDIEKSGIIFSLMKEKAKVSSFKKYLLNDDFGLIYLPDNLRRERMNTIINTETGNLNESHKVFIGQH